MKPEIKVNLVVGLTCIAALGGTALLVGSNFKVVWFPTLVFSFLFLVAVLRDVIITDGKNGEDAEATIGMNTGSALITGAAVVLVTYNSPLGFIIAILASAFYLPNIEEREWSKLIFNVSNDVLGGIACYVTLQLLDFSITQNLVLFVVKVLAASFAYVVVNYGLLAVVFVAAQINWREALYDLKQSLAEGMPLSLFAGFLGKFYFDYGPAMLVMFAFLLFLGRELHGSYARMAESQKSAIETLITALEAKDKYTAGHVGRVAMFAKYIGVELGYGPKRLERLHQAALLHDIGKLIVPSALLNKPGKLTEEEFKIIQRHEFVTIEILRSIDFLSSIAITAGGDHNKMKEDASTTKKLEPYIVSVCDAFDAMTSSRSYRKALPMEVAYEELQSKKGKQFHPKVVAALTSALEKRGEKYGAGYETDIVHEDAPEAGIGSAGIGDLAPDAPATPGTDPTKGTNDATTEPASTAAETQSQVVRSKVQGASPANPRAS